VEHYDVIIIGTGAGGGTLAHRLAPSGKRILLLERGGYLPREPENWDSHEVFNNNRYLSGEKWIDKDGAEFEPHQQYFVGGNTKFYGAILFRLRERDFDAVRHYGGTSPAWPLSYADLEPYYTEAERLYLVHGQGGEDPTEPWRSGEFPFPAVSHEPRIQQLHDDFERTGHRPFHLPVGVDLNETDPEAGRCVRCDRFDGFPCLADGKADAHVLCVRPALTQPNVKLRTHARVQRLETGADGRSVTEVLVDRKGNEERYSADVVVVACGAVNSAALLLRGPPSSIRAGSRTAPTRSAATTWPTSTRASSASRRRRTRRSSRRRSASTTTTGAPTTPSCRSGTSRCSARATATSCARARPGSRPASRSTTWPSTRSTSG